jgi:predicted oxidoreductase
MFPMGAARRLGMAKTTISNGDLVWVFTEKLKSFSDCAPTISIAIVPNKGGWTAIASRNDLNIHPGSAERIEQVQRELREIYILAKD